MLPLAIASRADSILVFSGWVGGWVGGGGEDGWNEGL